MAGRFGNSAIGVLEGPGTKNFHLGLFKHFRFGEKARGADPLRTAGRYGSAFE
jgi:hypothetical protein